jgi:hypothetical protein
VLSVKASTVAHFCPQQKEMTGEMRYSQTVNGNILENRDTSPRSLSAFRFHRREIISELDNSFALKMELENKSLLLKVLDEIALLSVGNKDVLAKVLLLGTPLLVSLR